MEKRMERVEDKCDKLEVKIARIELLLWIAVAINAITFGKDVAIPIINLIAGS